MRLNKFNFLITFCLCFYNFINHKALAQELKLYGKTQKIAKLSTIEFASLIPKDYQPKLIYENKDNSTMQGVNTCSKWNELSELKKSRLSTDKFTQIDLNNIKNICWIVELVKSSQNFKREINSNGDFSNPEFFPAGLAYNGFLSEKEYVKDSSIQPKEINDLTLEVSPYITANTKEIRKFIWSKQSKSLAALTKAIFEPSISMLTSNTALRKISDSQIEGTFLRTNFRITIIATGFDFDRDSIEDWAILNEINDATGNWSACYPAIISRKFGKQTQGPFIIKQSHSALRCG